MKDNTEKLTQLGSANTIYNYSDPHMDILECFENKYPNRDYVTEFIFTEFTSLCPRTHQPDFAEIAIRYIPDKECLETKSLKLYFLAYRNEGMFMETIVNKILEDCVSKCRPRKMSVVGKFNARGGTLINVMAEYEAN